MTAVVAVVLLHIGLIIAVKTGLTRQVVQMIKGPLDVKIIKEEVIPDKAPPPPPVKIETPPPFVPPPEISIELPPAPPENTIVAVQTPQPRPTEPVVQTVLRTAPKFDGRRSPSTADYYPPSSRRLGEEGTTTVSVCIGPDGRVVGQSKLEKSSGSTRLDEAALKYALRTRWVPGTEAGRPVQACNSFNVKFVLTN